MVIRSGRRLDQLEGEQLLHDADVVKTSGRHRREHLAWELMSGCRERWPADR
ncbi:hypothetical protein [Kribbella qitaiheensis]|uniref:hypothetical protein n=1 Tax=Kribbella qitaiheensis TaxID=1544730 RepID=UPI00162648D9|nr:hypothetical protein [Kribbella qitaiheensis]